jgi:putative transposase
MSQDVTIVKGSVGRDHVHVLLSCPPSIAPAKIVQYLKGRTSRLLQEEYPQLKKRYWGRHLWSRGYFCATVGAVTEELIKDYIANQDMEDGRDDFKVVDEFQSKP